MEQQNQLKSCIAKITLYVPGKLNQQYINVAMGQEVHLGNTSFSR